MIRGVFSIAGLVIILMLLLRSLQGEISLADVAVRGLVIVVCIGVIDKLVVPIVAAALRATNPEDPTAPSAPAAPGSDRAA